MKEIKYYYCVDRTTEIEIPNISYPQSFTDVMDGTWDAGSFEFFIDINIYKRDFNMKEIDVISRKIIEDGNVLDDTRFLIDEINVEKDSNYKSNIIKVTIKYVEGTKILSKYLMPNHTYSIKPFIYSDRPSYSNNNLYAQYIYKYFYHSRLTNVSPSYLDMIYERNYQNFDYKDGLYAFEPSDELIEISKQYPDKTSTYTDANFFDITRDCFAIFNAVPYLNMKDRKLEYISGLGKENNKKIEYNKDKIVVSNSFNRSIENNTDTIENKIVNAVCDFEELMYPSDSNDVLPGTVDAFNAMVIRPRGLNEGMESYQNWYNWYLELPQKIDNILAVVAVRIDGSDYNVKTKKIVTHLVVEKSSWDQLTETDKKYYAYFKRGDNKIYNIMQTVATEEDNVWPWDTTDDNTIAFQTSFAVQYKPIISTDILIVKNKDNLINKKNFVVSDKNSSDISIVSKTNYELEKGFYSQYMLEIAGEYQNIYSGELVDIIGFESYGIPSKKYLVYKVNTTWEKEGSHQIIYFNEMVAKNNVLLNEDNIVRITEQPSDETLVERIYKKSDLVEVKSEIVDSTTYEPYSLKGYGTTDFILSAFRMLFGKQTSDIGNPDGTITSDRHKIKSAKCRFRYKDWVLNQETKEMELSSTQNDVILEKKLDYFNSGTVSQAIMSTIDNIVFDYKGELKTINTADETKLKASVPVKYCNQLGVLDDFDVRFVAGNVGTNFNSQIYDEDNNLIGYTYPILPITIESFGNLVGKVKFGRNYVETIKDTRDILKLVYEQTYCSGNENLQLSNYFTSTSTSFAIDKRFQSDYLYKDILFFEGKVYNVNDIDENKAIESETIEDATSYMLFNDDYNVFIKIPDGLINGNYYTMVLRGVINRYKTGVNTYEKRMVPQLSFYFKKEPGTKYIKFSIDVLKL